MIGKLILVLIVVGLLMSITYISVDVGTDRDFQPNAICRRVNNTVECTWILKNETEAAENASANS